MTKTLPYLIAVAATLLLSPLALAQTRHAFIWNSATGLQDIGTLGGDSSYALGINDSGEVVGYSYLSDNITYHAFTWTASGGMVDLGALPGGSVTQGFAINAAGEVAGEGYDANGFAVPFYWSPEGGFVTLPESTNSYYHNGGYGINDAGDVTGQRYAGNIVHAYIWSPATSTYEVIGGNRSVGFGINNQRHITGTAGTDNGVYHAFYWDHSAGMINIGLIRGGGYTAGRDINKRNEVVGLGLTAVTHSKGFYWSRATGLILLKPLGGSDSAGFGINDSGVMAGQASTPARVFHAAIWSDPNSAPQDLGTFAGGSNSYGTGINNAGQVVGYSDLP